MPETPKILIVDDDPIILESLCEFLRLDGYEAVGTAEGERALDLLAKDGFNLVISDVNMPGPDGFELLRAIRKRFPELVVVLITGYGSISRAVEAIKLGAYEYLTKPIIDAELRMVVDRALNQQSLLKENIDLHRQLEKRYGLDAVIGQDYKMQRIFDLIETIADSEATILITGQSGTGKSLIARAIHHRSRRQDKPFMEVASGAIPETLLESELFGYKKGAFTGADSDKEGKFKAADTGTIFLDEIAVASPGLQVRLLNVLQDHRFSPVGSNETIDVDVRVILATNKDLSEEVAKGSFREDLYYRINVITIDLPPLAQRVGDIRMLAEHFLQLYAAELSKPLPELSDEALAALEHYSWPGNVRELENVLHRAVILAKTDVIHPADLPATIAPVDVPSSRYGSAPLKAALEQTEREVIAAALAANDYNRQATAQALQIERTTLYKKIKRYGLETKPAVKQR
ncbi:MAG: sigma-54-dependent Fis family transcriptional regulator [Phycisphaerae bacterium]|nr:sigma-54-dependent Fis family transcriptional regulator [Phycisphaerae bacterium]